ncbi:hypothetical protein BDZ97DRAFT_1965517 [Flammula alnicola]|nr:hypothetical protein BDZ97DRAFT_1965517 [Flammula alnicola]
MHMAPNQTPTTCACAIAPWEAEPPRTSLNKNKNKKGKREAIRYSPSLALKFEYLRKGHASTGLAGGIRGAAGANIRKGQQRGWVWGRKDAGNGQDDAKNNCVGFSSGRDGKRVRVRVDAMRRYRSRLCLGKMGEWRFRRFALRLGVYVYGVNVNRLEGKDGKERWMDVDG